jgi:RimJ/RimL family protein N-acetyltransferase
MLLHFLPMTEETAHAAVAWRYQGQYAVYDLDEESLPVLLDPANAYYAAFDAHDDLIGFCCFGAEARVPGGDYSDARLLDVGVGLRPDLTGRGLGASFMGQVLAFARQTQPARGFRVTIAAFNLRSQRVCERLGFRPAGSFRRENRPDGMPFVLMTLDTSSQNPVAGAGPHDKQ